MAHAYDGELFASYPAALKREAGMVHILTVAQDLNAEVRELPGIDLEAELGAIIRNENILHVTLIDRPGRGLLRRRTLAERLLRAHPHLAVHLVAAEA